MNESQSQTELHGTPLGQNQTEFVTCAEHVLVWVPKYILVHAKNLNTLLTKQGTSVYLMVLSVVGKDHIMDLAGRKKKIYFQGRRFIFSRYAKPVRALKNISKSYHVL